MDLAKYFSPQIEPHLQFKITADHLTISLCPMIIQLHFHENRQIFLVYDFANLCDVKRDGRFLILFLESFDMFINVATKT